MIQRKTKYILLAVFVLVGIASFLWVRSYVIENAGLSLHKRIQSLNLSGFHVRYDSISVNWLTNTIEIDNLILEKNAYDTTCIYPEFIAVGKVRARGIGLIQLVFRNILTLESLSLDSARMVMRQNSLLKLDSATQRNNEFALRVDHVSVNGANLMYTDSLHCRTISAFKSNLAITGLKMDFHIDKPFAYSADHLILDSTEVKLPTHFYSFRIRQVKMNFANRGLTADSIRIIPSLGKIEFGKEHGFEIDRFEATIPYLKLNNISPEALDSGMVKVGSAEIQFFLKVFRDKRLKFVEKQKLLPVAQLQELPFPLLIDSLNVTKSYVQYDEFGEDATEAGRIFFDDLYAVLHNITNATEKGNTLMRARARLLGHGDLKVYVTFPLQKDKPASLAGSIKDFNLTEINSMLTPSTQLKVESGQMKELSFNFTFNNVRSDGELELNYENLKLITFKSGEKARGSAPEKDNLKTFIMNTFIFRKNMDESVPVEKRKGTIQYNRDQNRSIFNFWSKSLISGIKSAYNLDKLEARKSDREIKKEERLSRREAKKVKREEKKKERG